jgi:glycerol-3-phosphate dehydrogenase
MKSREVLLQKLVNSSNIYDVIVIGGGASGVGIALEAATRGYGVLLLEGSDFAKSTSSKSTKLVHGGVRYLKQGDVALVREACIERGHLLKNAPHLVKNQVFVIPAFGLIDVLMYTVGLKFYDLLAGTYSLGRSTCVSKKKTMEMLPVLNAQDLTAGIVYHDGQFDDSRLAVNVLQSAAEAGADVLNYMRVTGLEKETNGRICGVRVVNMENGREFQVKARAVVNATGVFADEIRKMEDPLTPEMIRPSQGVHIILDKSFLPGEHALMIPKTDDGRVLFAVPWHNKVVVGTTDTPLDKTSIEPIPLKEEIDFILSTAGRYLSRQPATTDVQSVFAGLRPLAAKSKGTRGTRELSRSHKVLVSRNKLFTMLGGKWTTFRKMAEDMIDKVEKENKWNKTRSVTHKLRLHGYHEDVDFRDPLYFYGSDKEKIMELAHMEPGMSVMVNERLGLMAAQIVWAIRHEFARTVEDVLARRTRFLLLDASESLRAAPAVAAVMAAEMGKDKAWEEQQTIEFTGLASQYLLT